MKNYARLMSTIAWKRDYLLTITLVLIFIKATSQGFPDNPTQIKEIPPSPTMWEFDKYGNYPVSMHTGVPNISIPLTTAQSGVLKVPVSLSYHASGIKVDEKASWVGLGWMLNAGGAITRTVRGSRDEGNRGYINYPYDSLGTFDPAAGSNYYKMEEMLQGFIDTEPDVFNYNFLGYSGRFIFNHSTNSASATIALIPHNDLKVSFSSDFSTITIITPEGIKAEFGDTELSSEYRPAGLIGDLTVTAKNVWHLKKLVAPNGVDKITLEYELVPGSSTSPAGVVFEERTSESHFINYNDPCNSNNYTITQPIKRTSNFRYSRVKRIKKINFQNGYILFDAPSNNRLDDPHNQNLRLDAVKIYSSLNGVNKLINSYKLEYDYFGAYVAQNANPEYTVRLRLEKVFEVGSNGVRNNPHEFFYKDSGLEILPNRFSNSQDYWGYYNGKANSSLVPRYLYTRPNGSTLYLGHADRNVDINRTQAGIIEKIVFPTKGYTTFEFESNSAIVLGEQKVSGGLRIKNISSFNADFSLQWQKTYEYVQKSDSTLSSGVYNGNTFIKPRDFLFSTSYHFTGTSVGSCGQGYAGAYTTTTDGVSSSPSLGNNFATIFYNQIKVYNGNPINHEGYTWYHYTSKKDKLIQGLGPTSFRIDQGWDRGQLLLEETYEKNNSNPKSTVSYTYEKVLAQTAVSGFVPRSRFKVESLGYTPNPNIDPYYFRNIQYFLTYYSEPIVWKRLKSKTKVHDGITTEEDYFYNGNLVHTNLERTTSTDSKGNLIKTKTDYPQDLVNPTPAEQGLIGLHRITIPIQTETTLTKNGNELSKTTQRTNYKDWGSNVTGTGNIILPEFIQSAKGANDLEDRITYHDYDDKGNPSEVSKVDDTHVYYIWGYQQQYPIAKLENFTSNDAQAVQGLIAAAVSASNEDTDTSQDTSGQEGALRTALKNLRDGVSAQVTTYTYDPLIGVTSITDPRGYTIYYEYDDFNRLEQVKDAEGNIVSKNEYHYKN